MATDWNWFDEIRRPDVDLALIEAQAKSDADNQEFTRRWPAFCRKCGGWGGSSYQESHGFKGGGSETIFDLCGAIEDVRVCHRCGCLGLNEEGEGPCSACGWNFDDGLQEVVSW